MSVAVVAIGIAAELLDGPGQVATKPVQEEVQRILRMASRVVIGLDVEVAPTE